ncbi:MAG: hypothetical protein ACM3X0_02300 [Bacteroidota bacterium]
MSLLSPERLVASLSPQRLGVLRLAPRWRPGELAQHAEDLPETGPAPWTGGLEALEMLLDQPAWGGRDLTVLLSSHYVRYAVLPKVNHLGAAERTDLARLIFRNTFGDLARDWELRVSPGGDRPTLASGVPQALLTDLRAACAGRATLRSIQPGLMAIFNRARSQIDQPGGMLALVENRRITLATIEQAQWQSITSRAAEAGELPDLLAEARQLAGRESGGRLWLCDLTGQATLPPVPPWQVERLPGGLAGIVGLVAWGTA